MEWPEALDAAGDRFCRRLWPAPRAAAARRGLADHAASSPCWRPGGASRCRTASAKSIATTCAPASTSRSSTNRNRLRREAVEAGPPRPATRARAASCPSVEPLRARACCWCERGQPIQERQLDLLEGEHRPSSTAESPQDLVGRGIALFLIFSLLTGVGRDLRRPLPAEPGQSLPKIAGVCVLVFVTVASGTAAEPAALAGGPDAADRSRRWC